MTSSRELTFDIEWGSVGIWEGDKLVLALPGTEKDWEEAGPKLAALLKKVQNSETAENQEAPVDETTRELWAFINIWRAKHNLRASEIEEYLQAAIENYKPLHNHRNDDQ